MKRIRIKYLIGILTFVLSSITGIAQNSTVSKMYYKTNLSYCDNQWVDCFTNGFPNEQVSVTVEKIKNTTYYKDSSGNTLVIEKGNKTTFFDIENKMSLSAKTGEPIRNKYIIKQNDSIVFIGKTYFGLLHGNCLEEGNRIKFSYGREKTEDSLFKLKPVFLLKSGVASMQKNWVIDANWEYFKKYNYYAIQVTGCILPRKWRKAFWWRNFRSEFKQRLRHGKKWKEFEYHEEKITSKWW